MNITRLEMAMSKKIPAIGLCFATLIALSSGPILLTSTNVAAQNAFCGLLSGDARRVCEAAATLSRETRGRERQAPREVQEPRTNANNGSRATVAEQVTQSQPVSNRQSAVAVSAEEGTPIPVLENLLDVAIKGTYPPNYKPSWGTIIATSSPVNFEFNTNLESGNRRSRSGVNEVRLGLYKVDDFIVIGFDYGVISQLCMANVVGLPKVIGREVQNFELQNFRVGLVRDGSRSRIGDPCTSANVDPIYSGRGTLRSDADGNLFLAVEMQVQNVNRYNRSNSSYRLQEVRITNNMTPTMAVADLATKTRIAQETATREAEQRRVAALVAGYNARFPAARARVAALPQYTARTILSYKGYNLKSKLELPKVARDVVCDRGEVQFALRRQIVSYLDQEISLILGFTNFNQVADITTREPHEKDLVFAVNYVLVNKWNEAIIDLAARLAICDPYGTEAAIEILESVSSDSRQSNYSGEIRTIKNYLEGQRQN
jgi:hypothetical protein